jgi:hypothetical protein
LSSGKSSQTTLKKTAQTGKNKKLKAKEAEVESYQLFL